jgi:hypothetical protein
MSFSRKLRNIALSQINAIKERLDRIDAEAEAALRAELEARHEMEEIIRASQPTLRRPEEIAPPLADPITPRHTPAPTNPLSVHYRILGLEEGADLATVEATHARLVARCAPERFPEGSEERRAAEEILKRVECAYDALREALDPTAGRFDKLEL